MLNTSLFEANEHSTVLPSIKQITPSSGSNETEGVGDRSEVGRIPSKGQKKIFGNLDRQSTGQVGKLDTQGKESPTMFASHKSCCGSGATGAEIPNKYKKMLHESACGKRSTGTGSGKQHPSTTNRISGTVDPVNVANKADTRHGEQKLISESEKLGSAISLLAMKALKMLNS